MAKQTIVTDDLTSETENVSTYFYAFVLARCLWLLKLPRHSP